MNNIWGQSEYIIRKKVFSVMGAKLHIYNSSEELVLFRK